MNQLFTKSYERDESWMMHASFLQKVKIYSDEN